MKKFLVVAGLALSSLTVVSAKTYDIVLSNPTKVGSVQLKPGQYKLKVDGANAVFTDANSSKTFSTPRNRLSPTSDGMSAVPVKASAATANACSIISVCVTSSSRWRLAISATFGDGSAALTIRTFSGDIVIAKR